MKLNTIILVALYSISLLCSNVLGLNLRRDSKLTLSSSVQNEPEVVDINSLPSGDINQDQANQLGDTVSIGASIQNDMPSNRSSIEFHVDNSTNEIPLSNNTNPTIINNENQTHIKNSTSEVIVNPQEEIKNATSEPIVTNKTEEAPKEAEITPTPVTPTPDNKPIEEQVISNTDTSNKTEGTKNETLHENTYTNNPDSTPKVEDNKNETTPISPSVEPPKENITITPISENKTDAPAPTPSNSSSELINDTSSVQNSTAPEVIDNKNTTDNTPSIPEEPKKENTTKEELPKNDTTPVPIKNETKPEEVKNETTPIEPITPAIPEVKNETKPEEVKNETAPVVPEPPKSETKPEEVKNDTVPIVPELPKNETKNETIAPFEPLIPESPKNETKNDKPKEEPVTPKNETVIPSEPLIPISPKTETNTTKEESKNTTTPIEPSIPSEPTKPEIIYEPVEIVKEISPAGKAALEMEKIKDPEYLSIISKGYENPTYTTNIFAKHPIGVSVAATQGYLWKPNDPTDANLWQNVEYNKYQNQILDTSRYSTPAHFTVTEVGTPIVHAPSNSGLTIVTRVPQTITTTTTTVPLL